MIRLQGHPLLPTPSSVPSVSCTSDTPDDWKREETCWREWGGGEAGGRGGELYDRKKAWPSINHSILSSQCFCLSKDDIRKWSNASLQRWCKVSEHCLAKVVFCSLWIRITNYYLYFVSLLPFLPLLLVKDHKISRFNIWVPRQNVA